ncbi:hypothetical protein BofuT4_uP138130.1 [Botrytis cinerea T4]|uniref:Uncharacterized protein n=1 Tax=Botryotinia fuckeliana (strain T4) TaxID=999810 RepID=G2YMP1_BOTF4|nr:hypothetical protein BofuT4_uP138130.1 [Botrytis cinerea T4]
MILPPWLEINPTLNWYTDKKKITLETESEGYVLETKHVGRTRRLHTTLILW